MNITSVRIRKFNGDGKTKGVASITIDDEFVVKDIRIVDGAKGIFVAMPARRTPSGDFQDIAHPVTAAARTAIQTAILKEFAQGQSDAGGVHYVAESKDSQPPDPEPPQSPGVQPLGAEAQPPDAQLSN
ncbi:MAG TPA: septation regulator SpoVG [Firmicutes bacterium]|nr:septation regulator SpoVG [Bacillota bacterium]HHY99377.1 septation regulator SpoVG [Bacillota bacterium]